MAMLFRESNQVKWQGSRPAHNGTQVVAYGDATNGSMIIYTVTAGKTLFLCSFFLEVDATGAGGLWISGIWTDLGAFWRALARGNMRAAGQLFCPLTFWPPLEIPSQYDIVILSPDAITQLTAFVFGWEE